MSFNPLDWMVDAANALENPTNAQWKGGILTDWAADRARDTIGQGLGWTESSQFNEKLRRARESYNLKDWDGAAQALEGLEGKTERGRRDLSDLKNQIGSRQEKAATEKQNKAFEGLYGPRDPNKGLIQQLQDRQTATMTALQRQAAEAQARLQEISEHGATNRQLIANEGAIATQREVNHGTIQNTDVNQMWNTRQTMISADAQNYATETNSGRQALLGMDSNNVLREKNVLDAATTNKANSKNFVLNAGMRSSFK